MKKAGVILLLLPVAWAGLVYLNAAWSRQQFISEIDSLLQTPKDLSEANLAALIRNKAALSGVDLNPDEVIITISGTDRETAVSRTMEGKGVSAENRVLTLEFPYSQSVLGFTHQYTLTRRRFFTAQVAFPTPSPLPEE